MVVLQLIGLLRGQRNCKCGVAWLELYEAVAEHEHLNRFRKLESLQHIDDFDKA